MHDLCDYTVCLLSNRALGRIQTDKFYEFCKRSSGMDLAACEFKIPAFAGNLVVDLVAIRDYSSGESFQEILFYIAFSVVLFRFII